jgi:hypothetical protein
MKKNKNYIVVYENGSQIGYIKGVSYGTSTYSVTKNKKNAKGYVSQELMFRDIDYLVLFEGVNSPISFGYL